MTDASLGYKRLNHFHGQRLSSEDFRAGDAYFINKLRLHTRMFHSPGVVKGYDKELNVVAHRDGWAVEVKPGYAIDGSGNDIFLRKTEFVEVKVNNFPATCYIVLRYVEEPVDFWVNQANPKYKGHTRILESSKVEMSLKAPENDGIELARVYVTEDVEGITDAKNPDDPQAGEIDLRYVPRAGTAGCYLASEGRVEMIEALGASRDLFGDLARKYGILSARDIRSAIITLEMFLRGNQLNYLEDAYSSLELLGELQDEMILEVEEGHPELADHERWPEFRRNVEEIRTLLEAKRDFGLDHFLTVMRNQSEANADLDEMVESAPDDQVRRPPSAAPTQEAEPEEPEKGEADEDALEVSWDSLQELGKGFPPEKIFLDGQNFGLIDTIDVADARSEKEHDFEIVDEKEQWKANKTYKYPDKTRVRATGRAHVEGYSTWTIKNCTPGQDLLMAKRIDFSRGDLVTTIEIDGKEVGEWEIKGSDRRTPWRNWLFQVPGSAITSEEVTVKQIATKAERDVNMYGLWFFQAT